MKKKAKLKAGDWGTFAGPDRQRNQCRIVRTPHAGDDCLAVKYWNRSFDKLVDYGLISIYDFKLEAKS